LINTKKEREKVSHLMTTTEMQERHQGKEDPFDLTLKKWTRIRHYLDACSTLGDFQKLFHAAAIPVPFCFTYQIEECLGCPLETICARGRGEKFIRVMRIIQAYVVAGDMLPNEPLTSEIDSFIMELEVLRAKARGMIH
jgi:hypothetical protein